MSEKSTVEIRGFLHLNAFLRKVQGKMPLVLELDKPITGRELAERLHISPDEVEVIFVNGFVQNLDFIINPGDRMAFLPPGCPGPYRIALGFYGKNQENPSNFKIKEKKKKRLEIVVKLFANLRDNREKEQTMDLREGMTPKDVIEKLEIPFEDVAIIMINGRRKEADIKLLENDILALFPAVGGG